MSSKSKTLVLSCFEAFGGQKTNSSELLLDSLMQAPNAQAEFLPDLRLQAVKLPVEFEGAHLKLQEELSKISWDGLLMLGQAAKRSRISLEMYARNTQAPRFADNRGAKPSGEIVTGAPLQCESSWPFKELYPLLDPQRWELSENAGEYVCNELFYRQLLANPESKPKGFVHLPLVKEQGKDAAELFAQLQPAFSLFEMRREFVGFLEILRGSL